jgi:hypothetical protein
MPAYTPQSTSTLHVKLGFVDNGAVQLSSSANLAASLSFTAADVGSQVLVFGGAAVKVITKIDSVTDSTHAVLHNVPSGDINPGTAIVFRPYSCRTAAPISINNSLGVKDTASFTIQSLDGSFRPIRGQNVLIIDDVLGELFGGIIDSVKAVNVPGNSVVWSECQCIGFDYLLYKRTAGEPTGPGTPPNPNNGIFTGYTAGDIVAFLVANAAGADGLSTSAIAGPTVDSVAFDYFFTVGSAIDSLLQLINSTSTDLYYYYVDAWRTVVFKQMSTTAAPWNISTLDGSDANVLIQVSNTTDGAKLQNRCYINEGMYIADAIEQDFTGAHTGDPPITSWDVTGHPIASVPSITLNTVPQSVGIDGVDTGKDFYWQINSTTIRQDSGGTPLVFGDTLAVTYQGFVTKILGPSIPSLANSASIAARSAIEGGTGYYDTYIAVPTPSTLAGGTSLGASIVNYFGDVPSKVEVQSYRGGLRPGQNITVNLPEIGAAGTYMVFSAALDCSGNLMLWTYELVAGALLGDYRQALKNLAGGSQTASGSVSASPGPIPGPYAWNPGFEPPIAGDSMFTVNGFGVQPVYLTAADGTAIAQVSVWGEPAISVPSALIGRPTIVSAVVSTTGGTIKAGAYVLGVSAFDSILGGDRSLLSDLVKVVVPGGSTNKITVTVQWPANSFGGNLFVAAGDTSHGLRYEAAFGVGASTNSTTAAYDLTAVLGNSFGSPDDRFDHLEFDVFDESHAGSWALPVSVVGPGAMTDTLQFLGETFLTNQFAGCDISLLAFDDLIKRVTLVDMAVVSNTADTITVGPNSATPPVSPPDLRTLFNAGDVFVMRLSPTAADATSFTDSRLVNSAEASYFATAGSWASGTATLTIGLHSIVVGQFISVANSSPPGYDGIDLVVTGITATQVKYAVLSNPGTWVGGSYLGGLTQHQEAGNLAYILSGTGAGQAPKVIADNTTVMVNLATAWDVQPDATSRIVILAPTINTTSTGPLKISSYSGFNVNVATLLTKNQKRATFFIAAYATDSVGVRALTPAIREIFLDGGAGTGAGSPAGIIGPDGVIVTLW